MGESIGAKHRNGATDEIWLRFRSKFAKFQNEDEVADDDYGIPAAPMGNADGGWSMASRMNTMNPDGASIATGSMGDDNDAPF